RNRFGPLLVRRLDPGPGDDARSGEDPGPEVRLRHLRPRMARLRAAMAPLRSRLSRPRSPRDAAGPLGSFGRLDGFRGLPPPRMAHDGLPALLLPGRDLPRVPP